MVQGYHLYTDFHTLIGPIPYLIVALGILLKGPVADAVPLSIVLTLIPVAALSWRLLSTRYRLFWAFCSAAYLALLWCAPYPLHFGFWLHGYAMSYNRQAYVLVCLLFLSTAVRPQENPFLKGVLLGLLFFIKIPYFVVGVGFLGFYLFLSGISRRGILWIAVGFLTAFLPVFVYLGFEGTKDMVAFLFEAGRNRTPDVIESNVKLLWAEFPLAGTLVLALAGFGRGAIQQFHPGTPFLPYEWRDRLQLLAEPFVLLFGAFLTEMASSPLMLVIDIPLVCVYGFLVLSRVFDEANGSLWQKRVWCGGVALIAGLFVVLPMGMRAVGGIVQIVYIKLYPLPYPGMTHIDAPGLRDMQVFDRCLGYPAGLLYAVKVNDGIELLRRHPELDQAAVATLDFSDPFSFSLQRHSPPHMPVGLQYGFNVTNTVAPEPERIFEGCDAIMIPTFPDDPVRTFVILDADYRDYLARHFIAVDRSPQWQLLKRIH
jgi:hypothetical protein